MTPRVVSRLQGRPVGLVSCGTLHTAATTDGGSVLWTWGSGSFGCLGHGSEENRLEPTEVVLDGFGTDMVIQGGVIVEDNRGDDSAVEHVEIVALSCGWMLHDYDRGHWSQDGWPPWVGVMLDSLGWGRRWKGWSLPEGG